MSPEDEADRDALERSRLDHSTPERHDMDEFVADGLDDEANVTPDLDAPAEEVAVRIARESSPDERE
jgi:hypothetical protein